LEPKSQVGRPEAAPSAAGPAASPQYEPPAIAWEEAFEPVAATSCGLANPFAQNCQARPQV
jgi:hypothetical protein